MCLNPTFDSNDGLSKLSRMDVKANPTAINAHVRVYAYISGLPWRQISYSDSIVQVKIGGSVARVAKYFKS